MDNKIEISDANSLDIKELCYRAYMSRTDEEEFKCIHRKEPRVEFEKWWVNNTKKVDV